MRDEISFPYFLPKENDHLGFADVDRPEIKIKAKLTAVDENLPPLISVYFDDCHSSFIERIQHIRVAVREIETMAMEMFKAKHGEFLIITPIKEVSHA